MKAPPRAWQARNTNSAGHPMRVDSCPMVSTRLWTASSKIWMVLSRSTGPTVSGRTWPHLGQGVGVGRSEMGC